MSHNHVGLYRANLDFVAFLGTPVLTAHKLKKDEARPATVVTVDPDADLVKVKLWIAWGGKGMDPADGVDVEFSVQTETGAAEKAGSWREGSSANEKPTAPPAPPAKK